MRGLAAQAAPLLAFRQGRSAAKACHMFGNGCSSGKLRVYLTLGAPVCEVFPGPPPAGPPPLGRPLTHPSRLAHPSPHFPPPRMGTSYYHHLLPPGSQAWKPSG